MNYAEAVDDVAEFPFVATLPKREKSRVQRAFDILEEMRAAVEAHGVLVPCVLAAKIGGVSRQRVHELSEEGKLKRVEFDGHVYVTEASVVEWLKSERKSGRPVGFVKLNGAWQVAREYAAGK